jgi:hypothetical protein
MTVTKTQKSGGRKNKSGETYKNLIVFLPHFVLRQEKTSSDPTFIVVEKAMMATLIRLLIGAVMELECDPCAAPATYRERTRLA